MWTVSDISKPVFSGTVEFKDSSGGWHDFHIVVTEDRIVFGGICNVGFLESGYLIREDHENVEESIQEAVADLETYYNDGPRYVSRIVCNQRM